MHPIKRTSLIVSICVFSCISFFYSSCKDDKNIDPPIVLVAPAGTDDIGIFGDYVGLIKATRNVEVHARVVGYLEKMTFSEGKYVSQDEPLFYINNVQYKARLEKAKAQLKKDMAQESKAARDLERIKPLYEQNAASRLDLDNAIAAYDISKANVAMSKADSTQAQLEYNYTVVRSPISGYISERYADIGTLVGTGNSSLLARIVKRDTVSVEFKLTALDYLRSQRRDVHIGDVDTTRWWQPTVTVTLADNSVYQQVGVVDFASPQVDPKTGTFGVRADLPNPNQILLPGQFTRVKMLLDVIENATIVPSKSIIIEKGGSFIYVILPDSTAEKRFIETGPEQDNKTVVTRGLAPGENVVIEGFHKLTPKQKVIPRTREQQDAILEMESSKYAGKQEDQE